MSDARFQLLEQIARHASDAPNRIAYRETASGRTLSYGQLASGIETFSKKLRVDVTPSSVLMLKIANTCDFAAGYLGALHAGYTVFPVSGEITDHEFASAARRAGAVATVAAGLTITRIAYKDACVFASDDPAMLLQSSG